MAELHFTPDQQRAIEERGGAVLVSAAAGSGKTRVLVERLMRRVLDETAPCNIDDFLIITFTRKAAAELRARIAATLTERLAEQPGNRHLARQLSRMGLAQITTIDGFCGELVRANAFALQTSPDFRQIEGEEAERLRQEVAQALLGERYEHIAEDAEFRVLADTLGAGRSDGEIETALQQVYTSAQCHCYPDAWIEDCIRALDLTQYADAGQTPWGARLIEDFRRFCAGKMLLLKNAIARCAGDELVQQRYGPVLMQELQQLEALSGLETWDALHAASPQFARLKPFKKDEKSELQEQIKQLRDDCKDGLRKAILEFSSSSEQVMAELGQTSRALVALFHLVRDFSRAYAREKRRLRVLDFADLEHGAVRLLLGASGTPTELARELSQRYEEIMLDEYQDTNEVQDRLFAAISREGKNLFMVGDVKQAIYRFRLADPGIFLEKYRRFAPVAEAEEGMPRKILLSHNFRSDPGVLDAVNAVFTACMSKDVGELDYGEAEMLRPGKPRPQLPGPVVELHCINTKPQGSDLAAPDKDEVEAEFVASRIRRLLDEQTPVCDGDGTRPVRAEDIVILLRSAAGPAPIYEAALRRKGIACQSDRESSLLDAPEVETLLSLLQVIDNPRQDIPLTAVLMSPIFGISADALAAVRAQSGKTDLYTALQSAEQPEIRAACAQISELRRSAEQLELAELLTQISLRLQLEEVYSLMPNGAQRLDNLHAFFALASGFAEGGKKSLSQFLHRVETLRIEQHGSGEVKNAVRLMSIHKSKGLEFPVVMLAGLSRKFNDQDYRQQVLLHPELGAGCNVFDEAGRYRYHSIAKRAIISKLRAESRAEELRVLYVAMTRAQDRLIMSCCGSALDARLHALSQRLTLPPEPLLAAEARCPGDWVLEAALLRTEAGQLFRAAGKPAQTQVSDFPWEIRYSEVCTEPEATEPAPPTAEAAVPTDAEALAEAWRFEYPHPAAAAIPAKITATQLKGRALDDEVADGRPVRTAHSLRKPVFEAARPLTAAQRGTAAHLAMQYLDFSKTGSLEEIQAELRRLVAEEFLTAQQAEAVSPDQIARIFAGPVGQRIRSADRVIREFKFSVLTDASIYDPAGRGEQMLLQGVTDCCLIKDGALTVIDFKTDRVAPGEEETAAKRYQSQLDAYSLALGRIFALPVAEKILYFFRTDTVIFL